jgi:hypothetical protein
VIMGSELIIIGFGEQGIVATDRWYGKTHQLGQACAQLCGTQAR